MSEQEWLIYKCKSCEQDKPCIYMSNSSNNGTIVNTNRCVVISNSTLLDADCKWIKITPKQLERIL